MRLTAGAAVVALALSGGLFWILAFPGAPAGMQWPQHTMWGQGPTGSLSGTLVERDGCFYLRFKPGDLEYLSRSAARPRGRSFGSTASR